MKRLLILLPILLVGCADNYKEYAAAVKEQSVIQQIQIQAHQRELEVRRQRHQEKMMTLIGQALNAAARTPDKTDDVTVPLFLMLMEDKWATVETIAAIQEGKNQPTIIPLKAPETPGEFVQRAGGTILGAVSLGTNVVINHDNAKVLEAALASAGTHVSVSGTNNRAVNDSYKTGSQNTVNAGRDSSISGQDVNRLTENSEAGVCSGGSVPSVPIVGVHDGVLFVSDTCSCESYLSGHCTP